MKSSSTTGSSRDVSPSVRPIIRPGLPRREHPRERGAEAPPERSGRAKHGPGRRPQERSVLDGQRGRVPAMAQERPERPAGPLEQAGHDHPVARRRGAAADPRPSAQTDPWTASTAGHPRSSGSTSATAIGRRPSERRPARLAREGAAQLDRPTRQPGERRRRHRAPRERRPTRRPAARTPRRRTRARQRRPSRRGPARRPHSPDAPGQQDARRRRPAVGDPSARRAGCRPRSAARATASPHAAHLHRHQVLQVRQVRRPDARHVQQVVDGMERPVLPAGSRGCAAPRTARSPAATQLVERSRC